MVAADESTSMAWARVMRGISSSAKAVTPRAARVWIPVGAPSGSRRPTSTCRPSTPSIPLSPPASGRTWSSTRAASSTSARLATLRAPLSLNAASGYPAATPAPDSITTSTPALPSRAKAEGTPAITGFLNYHFCRTIRRHGHIIRAVRHALPLGRRRRRQRLLRLDARQRDEPGHPGRDPHLRVRLPGGPRLPADVPRHRARRDVRGPRLHLDGVPPGQERGPQRRDRDAARPRRAEHDRHGLHRARAGLPRGQIAHAR